MNMLRKEGKMKSENRAKNKNKIKQTGVMQSR